ncbi:DNRLRE domain-containing protein [Streptomyces sp. HUAS MG47]
MISSDGPGTNYKDNWRLSVGNTTTGASRALIRFPITGVAAGTKLDSADLKLYFDQTHTTGDTEVQLEAHRATQAWQEDTATWNSANTFTGELSGTSVLVDNGEAGRTAAVGSWPASGNTAYTQYAVNQTYMYNKDSVAGDTYTWQPSLPEDGTYQVETHYVPAADRATNAPYTVTYNGGTKAYTVNQAAGTGGVWKTLGSHPFKAGTLGKVVLGDGPASTTTAVLADAMRFTKGGVVTKQPGELNTWHSFPVTKTVQQWIDGTYTNNGFVIKAGDETANGPKGGPRYEGSEFGYGGETANYPRLVLTFGRQGVDLAAPTTIHDTGAELAWSAYDDQDPIGTGDDLVEYQVHRSINQTFTPSAATLVSPVAAGTTSYTDTSATPTKADDPDPYGRAYYYMVAVKTKDGQVVAAPTQLVRLPKAGRTTKVLTATQDTTLSSGEPTTAHDTIVDGGPKNWVTVGNNSATFGDTRAVLKFPALGIPQTARVLDAKVRLWSTQTVQETAGAVYELRPLTRDFDETATWVKADAATDWTAQGGDFGAVTADVGAMSNDPARHDWNVTSLAQSWVTAPSSQKGVVVKMADEVAKQERTLFLSSEGAEPKLHPKVVVTYIDSTTESTYYAPQTPARMTPNTDYTVDFTLTNTTTAAWAAGERVLSYTWKLPDGTDVTTGGNQVSTAIPALLPGESTAIQAQVKTPINSDNGNKRGEYILGWDVKKVADGTWLSAGTGGIPSLKQNVAVEDPTSNQLGMEKFYSYTGKNTGAGSTVMNNTAAGNSVWSYNAFSNPGRGLSTFGRFSYNSLDTSDTVLGHGWSGQISGPTRLGAPLDFHPNPNPTEIKLPDGDGTTHVFRKQPDASWKAPAGVHYKLAAKPGLDCTPLKDPIPDAWTMTRPDGTRFVFGCDGYMTSIVDKNGNTQTYTYEERKSNNKPTKFLKYITDPSGRQSLTVEYYSKADSSNPKIIDHVKSMTDVSQRKLTFEYSDKGLLTKITDGAGSTQPKVFAFEYDATQGNKNVKLVKVTDPRGNATNMAYFAPQAGDDPKYHWWTKTITDRLQGSMSFAYRPNTGNSKFTDTTVTDAENRATNFVTDDFGRPVQNTNAKSQSTKLSWDADNNVTYLEEANGAKTAYCYDQKTGYPLWQRDAENNKAGVPAPTECAPGTYPTNSQKFEYQTRADGFSADLFTKTSPEGRKWQFGYDTFGNLKTVTDPKGVATPTAGDYTTSYQYDVYGQLTKTTDPNGNPTTNHDFGPTGSPAKITDALNKTTEFVYDARGRVTELTDALGKKTTQTYDVYGRPMVKTVPKDQATGDVITTPAPVYDANDNVTTSTAPNGAVSTAVYDATDQIVSATAPKDTATSTERRTSYTYDKVGHLRSVTEPKGTLTPTDPNDYKTTNTYDEIYQLVSAVNAAGDKISYEYDNVGNVTKVVDPKKNATSDPDDYTTKTAYDLNHRVTTVTDAAGKTTKKAYDKDSLVLSTTDEENNTTTVTYDERGKKAEVKAPHDGTTSITYRTTKYEYDQVGNTTKVITPRGADTAHSDDFAARTEYDALNRPVKQFQPYDPNDGRYNKANVYTQTAYDEVGRVAKTSLPPSEGQTLRNDTTYSYFDNGWVKKSTDPWDIATTYAYNELGLQTSRTLTSAGSSSSRTMGWDYYPDGKLKTRTDDGVPVGSAVALVDNSDTQSTSATGTWPKGDLAGQQGYNHQTHVAGTGTDAFTWTLNVPQDGAYTAYVKYPAVTGATTTAKYTVTHATGTANVTKDQRTAAGTWVALGTYTFTKGDTGKLQLFQNSAGVVVADGVKLVRDNSAETDGEKRTFAYAYDANGNLTSVDDTSSGTTIDAYTISYTGLNQVQKVTEALAGQAKKATSYTYDANGQPDTVTHPDQYSKYTYDLRELVKTISVGKSSSDASPKVTSYTYTDRGQKLKETKANSNTVDFTYYLDGAIKTQKEKKANGTLVSEHTVTYDANGNKARDVGKKMNADAPSTYIDVTANYTYDPVDRISQVTKTGTGSSTETYVHDDNANVVSQNVKGVPSTFTFDRNRLQSATVNGAVAGYTYDPFGRLETISGEGKIVERKTYDGFDHVVESSKLTESGGQSVTKYTFDPLDRTTSKTSEGKTTEYDYLGLSGEVLTEEVAGTLTASYQYSPWGKRLSQLKTVDGTEELGVYGYNTRGDVESVSTAAGDTNATYGYTAYGKDDATEFTGLDKANPADPAKDAYNPYRFNAKRWDVSSSTYDMGFRDYNPDLNRFTTRDMYTGALADMKLGTDLMTGNRYSFTGGNPVSRVELDGHEPDCMGYNSFTCPRMDTGTTISGPGEWGNAWQYDPDAGSADSEPTPVSGSGEFGNSWQYNNTLPGASEGYSPPKEIPAWENFLGGLFDQAMGGGTPGESFLRDTTGYGTTKFLCVNVDAGMVWGYTLSGCLGSMRTEGGFDLAWVGSEGPELTTPGWTVSGTAGYSNADDWNQVRGSGLNLDGTLGIFTGSYGQAVNASANCMDPGSSLPLTSVVRNSADDPVGTFSFGVSTPGGDVGGSLTCTGVH